MKRNLLFFVLLLAGLLGTCFLPVGCRLFNPHAGDPDVVALSDMAGPPKSVGTAQSVSFRVVLPATLAKSSLASATNDTPEISQNPGIIAGIRASTATSTPAVTFKLTLLNIGNTANPTFTLVKTVAADASGTAMATFASVPALTCIGDIHIDGGKIGSYTDFHGAADLLPNTDNQILVGPKGIKTREDVLAEVLWRIIVEPDLFAKAVPRLTARLATCLEGRNLEAQTIYDDVITAFVQFQNAAPVIETASAVVLIESTINVGGGTIVVASQGCPIDGLTVQVPTGAYDGPVNVQITLAPIATATLSTEFKFLTPMIAIDDGGKIANDPVKIKIPVTVESGKIPLVVCYDPVTREMNCVPITDIDQTSVTISTQDLSGVNGTSASIRRGIRNSAGGIFAWNLNPGFAVVEVAIALLPDEVDSGFRPGANTWNVNSQGN